MSVATGLAELSAWQRANGNTSRECVDCGVCAPVLLTQVATIAKRIVYWQVCGRCLLRRMVDA